MGKGREVGCVYPTPARFSILYSTLTWDNEKPSSINRAKICRDIREAVAKDADLSREGIQWECHYDIPVGKECGTARLDHVLGTLTQHGGGFRTLNLSN